LSEAARALVRRALESVHAPARGTFGALARLMSQAAGRPRQRLLK